MLPSLSFYYVSFRLQARNLTQNGAKRKRLILNLSNNLSLRKQIPGPGSEIVGWKADFRAGGNGENRK
jgi:hypothetical protein